MTGHSGRKLRVIMYACRLCCAGEVTAEHIPTKCYATPTISAVWTPGSKTESWMILETSIMALGKVDLHLIAVQLD